MSDLALPRPENLRSPLHSRAHLVTSDVYSICERIQELSPNLYLYALDPPVVRAGREYNYSVCEMCADGVERLVKMYEELDGRIIQNLQRMLGIPFEQRFAEAEREEARDEAARKEAEFEELYEGMGGPMYRDLERCGFMQRPMSFPKRGVRPK